MIPGEYYITKGGKVCRCEEDIGGEGLNFPGEEGLIWISGSKLRLATNAELGKFIREYQLNVDIP
jgi:hypothetical protein